MAANVTSGDRDDGEGYDSFALDASSLAFVRGTSTAGGAVGRRGDHRDGGGSRASRSAATTQLATEVGSMVGARKDPFLKSVTFFDPRVFYRRGGGGDGSGGAEGGSEGDGAGGEGGEDRDDRDELTCDVCDLTHWDIALRDPQAPGEAPAATYRRRGGLLGRLGKVGDGFKRNRAPQLIVEDFEGLVEFSSLEPGDRLVSINGRKIKPAEFSAEDAMAHMRRCLEEEGVLHVTTENPLGEFVAPPISFPPAGSVLHWGADCRTSS